MQNTLDLDPLITVYQTHRLRFSHLGGLLLCGIVIVIIPLAVGVFRFYNGYTQYGPAAGYAWGTPWLAFAILAFLAWLVVLIRKLQSPSYKIQVNKNGLQFKGYQAARKVLAPGNYLTWDMLTGISVETIGKKIKNDDPGNGIVTLQVALLLSGGKKINLFETGDRPGSLKDLPELVSRIKANLYPRLTQKYNSAFSAGQVLTFGPIKVQKQGMQFQIHRREKFSTPLPWDQVRYITINSGYLVVELTNLPDHVHCQRRFPVSQIPNLELLLQIIKENVEG
jgi:hypothetical protein